MGTATVVSAQRAQEIEDASVTGASIENGDLVLKTHGGVQINVGRIVPALFEMYPVGSLYFTDRSDNPSTYMGGGTWVRWGKGRAVVGVDEAQTEFDAVEKIGGAKTHKLTEAEMAAHDHTVDPHSHTGAPHTHAGQLHSHSITHDHANATVRVDWTDNTGGDGTAKRVTDVGNSTGGLGNAANASVDIPAFTGNSGSVAAGTLGADFTGPTGSSSAQTTSSAGGNTAHNNLQPYITTYVWKRTK